MDHAYLKWLSGSTASRWWHDSADLDTMDEAIANGATGVTTNPLLVKRSLYGKPELWKPYLAGIPASLSGPEKAEEIVRRVTTAIAGKFEPIYNATRGGQGYVCAQVDPTKAGDADIMLAMARRLHAWAPNIAVKLPVTAAGLEALEQCVSEGITVTATVSFTVPQALAIARAHLSGLKRAARSGNAAAAGRCFAVVMVGRLDEYLRDMAHDSKAPVPENDIIQSGTAVIKRAYRIFNEEGYRAVLMPAGMRGAYHASTLSGAAMSMSIAPGIQKLLLSEPQPWHEQINEDVPAETIRRLMTLPEFARAYEPDGMRPEEFIACGVVQRTLSQFVDAGWLPIVEYPLPVH